MQLCGTCGTQTVVQRALPVTRTIFLQFDLDAADGTGADGDVKVYDRVRRVGRTERRLICRLDCWVGGRWSSRLFDGILPDNKNDETRSGTGLG